MSLRNGRGEAKRLLTSAKWLEKCVSLPGPAVPYREDNTDQARRHSPGDKPTSRSSGSGQRRKIPA